jgi:hypothetical protein
MWKNNDFFAIWTEYFINNRTFLVSKKQMWIEQVGIASIIIGTNKVYDLNDPDADPFSNFIVLKSLLRIGQSSGWPNSMLKQMTRLLAFQVA